MHCLRRAFVRALATPSAISTSTTRTLSVRPLIRPSNVLSTLSRHEQKRFASDSVPVERDALASQEADLQAAATAETAVESSTAPIPQAAESASAAAEGIATEHSTTSTSDSPSSLFGSNQKREHATPRPAPQPGTGIYVGNLSFGATQEDVRSAFEEFGEVREVRVPQDNEGVTKGFAHIEYANIASATAAIKSLDRAMLFDRCITVQYKIVQPTRSNPNDFNPPSGTLYVYNINFEAEDAELQELFGPPIKGLRDVRIGVDRVSGKLKGNAHVEFLDVESATAGRTILEGKKLRGRQIKVQYAKPAKKRSGPRPAAREQAAVKEQTPTTADAEVVAKAEEA